MRLIKSTPIALAVSAALATSLQVSTAFAQESESMLEEVMVTARKREESTGRDTYRHYSDQCGGDSGGCL